MSRAIQDKLEEYALEALLRLMQLAGDDAVDPRVRIDAARFILELHHELERDRESPS